MALQWIGSPNFTGGRQGRKIDRILIHWIVGNLAAADSVFQNRSRGTSAHYGVEDGTIHQYVNEWDTAYHAGNWDMNLRSIGIEHSAAPDRAPSAATYRSSAELVAAICTRYGIPCDRAHILQHKQVVATQCPGNVDIDRIVREAASIIGGGGALPWSDEIYIPTSEDYQHELYRTDLGRSATAGERRSRLGMPQSQIFGDIVGSPEATASWTKFVTDVFNGMLFRPPTETELKGRVDELRNRKYTPKQFIDEVMKSAERAAKLKQIAELEKKAGQQVLDTQVIEENFIQRIMANIGDFFRSNKTK